MPRPITVRLIGGLGNQLFGYYAGAALAGLRRTSLRLDTSHTRHGITDHGIAIRDFDLSGDWLPEQRRWSTPGRFPSRAMAKLVRDYPSVSRTMRIHESTQVGHDPALLQQPAGARLRGYYHSWRIVSTALDFGAPRRPDLRTPSEGAAHLAARAEQEAPVIVHVRRGDYAKVDGFGLLSSDYYAAGIERLRTRGVTGPVWIFSDDPEAAARIVPGEVISGDMSAAEEMWVMSHGAGHVTANSTFSWWAAWMNHPRTPVVTPTPWFRDGPVVDGLIPPEWDRIDSVWE
jgi:hypothetical protein